MTRFSTWVGKDGNGPKEGGTYLVYCSERATRGKGFSLYVFDDEDIVEIDEGEENAVFRRISGLVEDQQLALAKARKETMLRPPREGEVPRLLAMLLDEETQSEATRRLIDLPEKANRALAMHMYDVRPIPAGLISPDEPAIFHVSPMATCECIQDVVAFILGQRTVQWFGSMDEASPAKRSAIADAWFYWIMARKQNASEAGGSSGRLRRLPVGALRSE